MKLSLFLYSFLTILSPIISAEATSSSSSSSYSSSALCQWYCSHADTITDPCRVFYAAALVPSAFANPLLAAADLGLGFAAQGVRAGSYAANLQSKMGGYVAKGGKFAFCQSAAMGGAEALKDMKSWVQMGGMACEAACWYGMGKMCGWCGDGDGDGDQGETGGVNEKKTEEEESEDGGGLGGGGDEL